jgi:putative FmdB family regulatory protein
MPTYEYACSSCGNLWEEVQRISEPALETCPKCGEPTAKRQISGGGAFILKGGGWYSDLYSSAKKPGSSETKSGASTPDSSSTAKGDAPAGETKAAPDKPSGDSPSGGTTKPAAA